MEEEVLAILDRISSIFSRCAGMTPANAFKGFLIDLRGKSKLEQVRNGLADLFKRSSSDFAEALERLVTHHTLPEKERARLVYLISSLGYTLGEDNTISLGIEEGLVLPDSRLKARMTITSMLEKASVDLLIFDNYVNEDVLKIVAGVQKDVMIRILTHRRAWKEPFVTFYRLFSEDRKGQVELRTTKSVHDRYISIDSRILYAIGHSLKDIGSKLSTISRIKERTTEEIAEIERIWDEAVIKS